QYSGEKFTVTKQRPVAGGAVVFGRLTQPTGPPLLVEFRVKGISPAHKAVDIKVAGVSMPLAHRKEYASVIRRSGGKVEGLLKGLREKAATLEKFVSQR
ncbi:MAG: ABC transporter substrate-binding protein, partial [Alphaproteobacteria bacterium]